MRTSQLLKSLKEKSIVVFMENGKVKIDAPKEALTQELLSELRARKQEILDYLNMLVMRDYCGVCKARLYELPGGQWECPTPMCTINRLKAGGYIN